MGLHGDPKLPSPANGFFGFGGFDAHSACTGVRGAAMPMAPYSFSADIVAALVGDTGTMTCAYGVPFHITQGPPLFGSVG